MARINRRPLYTVDPGISAKEFIDGICMWLDKERGRRDLDAEIERDQPMLVALNDTIIKQTDYIRTLEGILKVIMRTHPDTVDLVKRVAFPFDSGEDGSNGGPHQNWDEPRF